MRWGARQGSTCASIASIGPEMGPMPVIGGFGSKTGAIGGLANWGEPGDKSRSKDWLRKVLLQLCVLPTK
jgi:hypothetical protein